MSAEEAGDFVSENGTHAEARKNMLLVQNRRIYAGEKCVLQYLSAFPVATDTVC